MLASVPQRCLRSQTARAPSARPSLGTQIIVRPVSSSRGALLSAEAQNSKRRERVIARNTARNKEQKEKIKSTTRLVKKSCEALLAEASKVTQETDLQVVDQHLSKAFSSIDKAVNSGWLHRNTAARKKGNLSKMRRHVLVEAGLYTPPDAALVAVA
jgi:small subunit ribosomal protein S20